MRLCPKSKSHVVPNTYNYIHITWVSIASIHSSLFDLLLWGLQVAGSRQHGFQAQDITGSKIHTVYWAPKTEEAHFGVQTLSSVEQAMEL